MREAEFLHEFFRLLDEQVAGITQEQKLHSIRDILVHTQQAEQQKSRVRLSIVPFMTGRRPIDEATHPGLGSSDNTSMILPENQDINNHAYILYALSGLDTIPPEEIQNYSLDVSLSFCGSDASVTSLPIQGWDKRPIAPAVLEPNGITLRIIQLAEANERRLVIQLNPAQDFLPDQSWPWHSLDETIRCAATDGSDPFTFGHMFTQMLLVQVRLIHQQVPVASAYAWLDICDTRRFGSLYQRVLERLVKPDTLRQVSAAGVSGVDYSYHPWYPVLLIGSEKAALYTRALVEDIVHKKRHLTDPRWLMRVGLYLEFLSCIGIFEAVREDIGDLLTPAERTAYETDPLFAEIRKRINPKGWKDVWDLREIIFSRFGAPQAGPVSIMNLLQKRKATLAFLHVHHQDLKHAIDLAGQNVYNAQETWHRVFRDAERAVLRKTTHAFPELAFLNPQVKDFVLWHQKGKLNLPGLKWVPRQFTMLFGDQDGLYASACNQYRASMNEVAEWAKHKDRMDFTGDECVPCKVSLLQAYMDGQESLLEKLQHRDGYAGQIEVETEIPDEFRDSSEQIYALLSESPIFSMLSREECLQLAQTARKIILGPMERIIIQGREGSSLFIVGEGYLEALVRQANGTDQVVDQIEKGDLIGEFSLLTGAPRSATVRAVDGAVVYEIGKSQYEPIIRSRPELVDQLAAIMQKRLEAMRKQRELYEAGIETANLSRRIHNFFFGSGELKQKRSSNRVTRSL